MISNKYWLAIIKILIFSVFVLFLIYTFIDKSHLYVVVKQSFSIFIQNPIILIIILLFSVINWMTEIKKWQVLVNSFKKISFLEATIQTLTSHSMSLFTPYKTGDFAWKLMYFNKTNTKKILYLNAVNNLSIAVFTYIFGIVALVYLFLYHNLEILKFKNNLTFWVFMVLIVMATTSYLLIPYLKKIIKKHQLDLQIDYKSVGILALFKYLIFSHQFYVLLIFFNVSLPYSIAISGIFSVYIISSLFPILSIADVVVKGSVAILIFSQLSVEPEKIITITTLLWLFNFLFPSLIGGIMILTNNTKDWKLILKKTTA